MRIRKRLATSSSDLHLQQSAAPAALPPDHQPTHQPKQPSGQSMPIESSKNRWVFSQDQTEEKMKQKFEDDETYWRMEAKKGTNNDIRKIVNICDGEEGRTNKILQPSSSSAQESWCEGDYDEVVPLKKRRGGFERNMLEEERMSADMKSKTNNKCVDITTKSVIDRKPVIIEERIVIDREKTNKSKIRGNVIMEGSRCSRINGRGWRCHQPTLVGYSLCEHHLCKGRLRSAVVRHEKVVRHGGGAEPPEMNGGDATAPLPLVVVTKKRTKVGVVKARSMSSLLSQI